MVSTDKDSPLFTPLGQVLPLYTKQEQEPVGQLQEDAFGRGQVMWFDKPADQSMLYTTPPQRTWVGLTDEDFLEACQIAERGNYLVAFQHIQAKLKDKNVQR